MNNTVEKGISEIVGCVTDPVIVFPGGWGDTIPEWLKTAITLERMEMNMRALKGDTPTGTNAEACVYLNTASLTAPMDNDWSQIYLYVATQSCRRWQKGELPADIIVDSISDYQMRQLNRLKEWLYQRRVNARKDRDRAERIQEKEETEIQKKLEQPALFEF